MIEFYTLEKGIDYCRLKELQIGQLFYFSLRSPLFKVLKKTETSLRYREVDPNHNYKLHNKARTIGGNSMLFVKLHIKEMQKQKVDHSFKRGVSNKVYGDLHGSSLSKISHA